MYYLSSKNKGTYQLPIVSKADLRLCFHLCKKLFSHDWAQI